MGPYLVTPVTQKITKFQQNQKTKIRYSLCQMQGWRRGMQDDVICQTDLGDGNSLFAVFDGHGGISHIQILFLGCQVAKFVAKIFKTQLIQNENYKAQKYKDAMFETFIRMDKIIDSQYGQQQLMKIHKMSYSNQIQKQYNAQENSNKISRNAGCTANVVLITKNKLIIGNAGDSRSVLSRSGESHVLSKDHKPQLPQQLERIKKAGGQIINGRINKGLNLSRSFGDFIYKQNKKLKYDEQLVICKPDVLEVDRIICNDLNSKNNNKKDQFILIGCDGIWQKYLNTSFQLMNRIRRQIQQQKINEKQKENNNINRVEILKKLLHDLLANQIIQELGCDNMTVILIEFL